MKNGNEKPTKQELINAGFGPSFYAMHFIPATKQMTIGVTIDSERILLYAGDPITHVPIHVYDIGFDKETISYIYHSFTGKELDFEPKEKDYSWEECFGGEGYWVSGDGDILDKDEMHKMQCNKNVYKTKAQAKQALALAQLSWIIPAINEDYPRKDGKSIGFDFEDGKLTFGDYHRDCENFYTVTARCTQEGAAILIKQHAQLIKEALMI